VDSFAWSPDSSEITYRVKLLSDVESDPFPVADHIVSISPGRTDPTFILEHPRMPYGGPVWTGQDDLYFIKAVTPESIFSSNALWKGTTSAQSVPTRIAYGEVEDVNKIVGLGSEARVAVEVASGLLT
jgi:hypothetical protein